MRSLFKLSLATLLALFVAGTVMAAEVKWSGNIGAGFGQVSYGAPSDDVDGYSEYITSYEANIRATVVSDKLTANWRLRSRGHQSGTTGSSEAGASSVSGTASSTTTSTCTLADGADTSVVEDQTCTAASTTKTTSSVGGLSYAEIWYKPVDNFTIGLGRFQGQAWSQPMSGTYLILNIIGAPEYFMNWTGIDGLDLEFNAGVVQVGLGIATECRPSCGKGAVTATQTIVPHLTGKFGDIGVRVQAPQGSGKDAADETVSGSGYQVGVSWAGMPGVYVGLDLQSYTDKEAGGADTEDATKSGTGLRVDFSGIQLGYWSGKVTNVGGAKDVESTETFMKLSYTIKVGDNGALIPEYTTGTKKANEDADAVTNSLVRLVGNVTF